MRELLLNLLEIDSTSGKEEQVANYLADWLRDKGYTVQGASETGEQSQYVLAYRGDNPMRQPVLCSHLDTVPPFIPPSVAEEEEVVYGRGSCDAKGQVVSLIEASERAYREGITCTLLFTYGEETEHYGIKEACKTHLFEPPLVIVGEPTELKQMTIQKGCVSGEIIARGTSCHSGYPHLGYCALTLLMRFLLHYRYKYASSSIIDINYVITDGGLASNVIPERARAEFTIRSHLSVSGVKQYMKCALKTFGIESENLEINYTSTTDPVELTADVEHLPVAEAGFVTDMAYFWLPQSTKRYLVGAGSIRDAHTRNEHVKVSDLERAVDIYLDIIKMNRGLN